jgi:nuclear transport factor 2 (NTF2) superfamily protein
MSRKPRKGSIARQLCDRLGGNWRAVRDPGEFHYHWVDDNGNEVKCYGDTEFNRIYLLATKGPLGELRRVGCNGDIYA